MLLHMCTQMHGFTRIVRPPPRHWKALTLLPCRTPLPLRHCANIVSGYGMEETSLMLSSPLSFILHAAGPVHTHTHTQFSNPSPVQMTIFSCRAAILEFVADWLLRVVWAAISSGMSGLLSNHSRVSAQGGRLEALITSEPAVARGENISLSYSAEVLHG